MSIIEPPVLAFITEEDRLAVGAGTLPGDPPTMDAAVQQLLDLRAADAAAQPKASVNKPEPDKEIIKETSSEKLPLDKPDRDKAHADKSDADKADSDKPAADKSDVDKADADKPAADKSDADKANADKPGTDKSDADKADADKTDRDNTDEESLIEREPISDKTDIDGDGEDDDAQAGWFSGSLGGRAGRSPVVM